MQSEVFFLLSLSNVDVIETEDASMHGNGEIGVFVIPYQNKLYVVVVSYTD